MKKVTPEKMINRLRNRLIHEFAIWEHLRTQGGQDPFWPDGTNMNLTRNHIISYKRDIEELCSKEGFTLPEEYYFPTPSEVDKEYMANLNQRDRTQRLKQMGAKLTTKRPDGISEQQSIF